MKKCEDFCRKSGEDQKKRSSSAEKLNFSRKLGKDQKEKRSSRAEKLYFFRKLSEDQRKKKVFTGWSSHCAVEVETKLGENQKVSTSRSLFLHPQKSLLASPIENRYADRITTVMLEDYFS